MSQAALWIQHRLCMYFFWTYICMAMSIETWLPSKRHTATTTMDSLDSQPLLRHALGNQGWWNPETKLKIFYSICIWNMEYGISNMNMGEIMRTDLIHDKKFNILINEEHPTSCSPKKVFPTNFQLAWKFWENSF